MLKTWNIGDDQIELVSKLIRYQVRLNGVERGLMRPEELDGFEVALSDGSVASFSLVRSPFAPPLIRLSRNGRRILDAITLRNYRCRSCDEPLGGLDEYCGSCGAPTHDPTDVDHRAEVNQATNAIRAVAVLFLLSGVVLFFVARVPALEALEKLAEFSDDQILNPIEGVVYTAGELRTQIRWEMWGVLLSNTVLAAFMAGFSIWSKAQPLPAMLAASALYGAVIVLNAIVEPSTLLQGWIVKLIVISYLVRGTRAALRLREAV